jgi:hypothetical protein
VDDSINGWCYKTKNGACLALFLHCITNLHLRHKEHWAIEYLKVSKELLLLMPTTKGKDSSAVVAVFYRTTTDDQIRLRQITNRCGIQPPMVIAHDYNQYFERRRKQMCS